MPNCSIKHFRVDAEFDEPIKEGFKCYLRLSDVQRPPKSPNVYANEYLTTYREINEKLALQYFPKPIDEKVVQKSTLYGTCTRYQFDFCDLELKQKEAELLKAKPSFSEGMEVPLTSQKDHFRNPIKINSRAFVRVPKISPRNHLGFEENIRKIKKITTGDTEYKDVICKMGASIIEDELHGKMIHL